MKKAKAIVTDVGNATGHAASLAREFGIPALLDTEIATTAIKDGQEITVDAYNSKIYQGKVDELMKLVAQESPVKRTEAYRVLQKAMGLIAPLNLVDPSSADFKAENCLTFHDIIRFCHEKSMYEMFKIGETATDTSEKAKRFAAGIPIGVYLIDLGGGSKKGIKKLLPEHIYSIPFNAFYKGLISMKWPEPRPVDTKGFLGMIVNTTAISEHELRETGKDSFAFISKEYMNFSLRLGYHFSTIEAFAGENINENYIRFFFKGGGAARERRLRRVRLIDEILKALGFNEIIIHGDVVDAKMMKYRADIINQTMEMLGKLTVYTKQLDMVMYNNAITDWYIEEFVKEHLHANKPTG
jgi:pyruvate,water dikinase